jgi:phytoene desaturase
VVGAGLGGLSAAARLAAAGYEVEVYEKNDGPGGKAASRRIGGYRFDTGPSLFTMPGVFRQFFDEIGLSMEAFLRPLPLDPICTYYLSDGAYFKAFSDPAGFGREIEEKTSDSKEALFRYISHGELIHKHAADLFLWNSVHDLLFRLGRHTPAILRKALGMYRIDPLRSLHRVNAAFFKDPRLVQFFDRYATYNGSSPYRTPGTLAIIPYVEYALGGFAVEGGIRAVPLALEAAGREKGVRFHYGSPVEEILHDRRRVRGIRVMGNDIPADLVVCNTDVSILYRDLLRDPGAPLARRYRRLEPSSSGLVFLWGMKRRFPELTVNNIFFSADYPAEFDALFHEGLCPAAPTVYVNITSKVTPEDAPREGENWFVLVNAPHGEGQDWTSETARVREAVLSLVGRRLGLDVEPFIEVEEIITPREIEAATGSPGGSLYGISSNTRFAAFLRHPNRVPRYGGIYVCGGSAHPGGGMPLAVLSGKIAADLARKDEKILEAP